MFLKNIILYDFNNLAVRNFFSKDVNAASGNPDIQLWKYFIISQIYDFISSFDRIDEVVLAVDCKRSWRKLYWNRYKESRKHKRDVSNVDWNIFHRELDSLIVDIKEYLPFKVIKVSTAEADDVIAVICMTDTNNFTIVSVDEDYLQLYSNNVKIYNPSKKSFIEDILPEDFVVKKCLMGQPKDDIFNIKTPLDWPNDKRKPGFGEKSAQRVINEGYQEWLKKNNLEERFKVNRVLIDFNMIPGVIRKAIMKQYRNYELPDASKIFTFFKMNKFRGYIEEFDRIERKLLELYGG
jgi:5'-3' exonuclease